MVGIPAPASNAISGAVEELTGPIVTTGCVSTAKLATPSTCKTNRDPLGAAGFFGGAIGVCAAGLATRA